MQSYPSGTLETIHNQGRDLSWFQEHEISRLRDAEGQWYQKNESTLIMDSLLHNNYLCLCVACSTLSSLQFHAVEKITRKYVSQSIANNDATLCINRLQIRLNSSETWRREGVNKWPRVVYFVQWSASIIIIS